MKKLLIGIGALVVLVIAAALVGPSFYDWNSLKPQIAAQVRQATGRELAIDGDISLSILPAPTLSAEGVRFANAEGGSAPDMATLEALDVRVAFMPLLQGNIQVESVSLVGPTILLERFPDGRGNWEVQAATAGAGEGQTRQEGDLPDISLDRLAIENGTLIYRDAGAGTEERLEAVDATVSATSLQGPFRVGGQARLRGIPFAFEASTGTVAQNQAIPLSLSLTVPESEARAMFGGSLRTDAEQGASLTGRLQVEGPSLAKLVAALAPGAALPAVLADSFAVDGQVEYLDRQAAVRELSMRLGETSAAGLITVDTSGPLFVRSQVKVNRLDLDRLVGPPASNADATSSSAEPASAPPSAAPFTIPHELGGGLEITIDAIGYRGGVISDAQLVAAMSNGEITITRASALLPGGSDLAIAGTIDADQGVPRFAGAVEASSDNLRSLLDWLSAPLPVDIASDRLRQLSMTGRITATPSLLQVADIDLRVDASRATGGIAVALPEPGVRVKPGFGVGLAVDKINLDGYLGTGEAGAGAEPGQSEGSGRSATPGEVPAGLPLHVLRPLAEFDANIELRVGSLTYNRQTMQGLHVDGTLQAGNLTLRDLSVQEFAGGEGALSGQVTDLAGNPRFDTSFKLATGDAGRVLQFAGIDIPGRDRLGRLRLQGTLAGGREDISYDASFSIGGIGAEGQARGEVRGLGAGIPRIDTDLSVKAKDAGPLLELAGLAGAAEARLGALDLTGKAASGADDLTYDLSFSLSGVGSRGQLAGKITAISTPTPQVDTRLDLSAEKPAALLRLAGLDGPAAGKLGPVGVTGTMTGGADAMRLDLALAGLGGNAKVVGTIAGTATPATFDLQLEATHPELRQLLTAVIDDYRPSAETLGAMRLATKANGSTDKASLSDLTLEFGPSRLTGTVTYDSTGPRPMVLAALSGNTIDLTGFTAADGTGSGGAGGAGGGRWSREPLDLSALDAFDADADITADALIVGDIRIDRLNANLRLRDGTLSISHLTGNAYGGTIDLTGQLAGRGVPSASGKLVATNLDAGQLMSSGLLGSRITGPVSLNADLRTIGLSMAELVQGLDGSGTLGGEITVLTQVEQQVGTALLDLLGTKVKEIRGITDTVSNVFGAFAGQPSKLTGSFTISDGVLETRDAQLENANARLVAQGEADLAAWTMDMLANIFRQSAGEAPYLTVALNGALNAPNAKFSGGGLSGSVPAPNQGVGGILQQVVPGLSGGGGSSTGGASEAGTGAADMPGGPAPEPGALGTDAVPEATPAPEPTAEPEAAPAPEPAAEPQPTVEPEPAPAAEPEAAPAPEPAAEPQPTAEPEPAPAAEPEAAPAPEPAEPVAEPEPAPEPQPPVEAEPAPAPEPIPDPGVVAPEPGESVPSPHETEPVAPLPEEAAPAADAPTETPDGEGATVPDAESQPQELLPAPEGSAPGQEEEQTEPGAGSALPGFEGAAPAGAAEPDVINDLLEQLRTLQQG